MKKTIQIRISQETKELLNTAKIKFRYSSMDNFIEDSCSYFLNYEQSPKEVKEPIGILFNKFSDRFFGAFNKTNRDILNPFIKDSYSFFNKVLEDIKSISIEKNVKKDLQEEPKFIETKKYNENEDTQKLKNLILELDKAKNNTTENGISYIKIPVLEYNKIMDKIKMM